MKMELFSITFFINNETQTIESNITKKAPSIDMGLIHQVLKEFLEHTKTEVKK